MKERRDCTSVVLTAIAILSVSHPVAQTGALLVLCSTANVQRLPLNRNDSIPCYRRRLLRSRISIRVASMGLQDYEATGAIPRGNREGVGERCQS
jgi:hypothetical protein